jgi:hypothetical protein
MMLNNSIPDSSDLKLIKKHNHGTSDSLIRFWIDDFLCAGPFYYQMITQSLSR